MIDHGDLTMRKRSLIDRKSTRLNSSHLVISYAVFCLKKNRLISRNWNSFVPFDPTSPNCTQVLLPRSCWRFRLKVCTEGGRIFGSTDKFFFFLMIRRPPSSPLFPYTTPFR